MATSIFCDFPQRASYLVLDYDVLYEIRFYGHPVTASGWEWDVITMYCL